MNDPTDNLPRPLPIRPRPAPGDSTASYIRRLARANHLRPGYLRRYLNAGPDQDTPIRLDWLAALAGRPLPALQHALAGPNRHRTRTPELFTAIRRDAHHHQLSIRALAERHGVHRRTIRQALASPTPDPRKKPPPRRSRLDPFKPVIDTMLRNDPHSSEPPPRTIKQIFDRLRDDHEMTDLSYSTVRNYVILRHGKQAVTGRLH